MLDDGILFLRHNRQRSLHPGLLGGDPLHSGVQLLEDDLRLHHSHLLPGVSPPVPDIHLPIIPSLGTIWLRARNW